GRRSRAARPDRWYRTRSLPARARCRAGASVRELDRAETEARPSILSFDAGGVIDPLRRVSWRWPCRLGRQDGEATSSGEEVAMLPQFGSIAHVRSRDAATDPRGRLANRAIASIFERMMKRLLAALLLGLPTIAVAQVLDDSIPPGTNFDKA